MTHIDDIALMAYADGELSADEARAVQNAFKDDSEIRARLQSFQATGELLEKIYVPVLKEAVPEALQKVVEREPAESKHWRRPKTWAAMAASVAVIASAGIITRELMLKPEQAVLVETTPIDAGANISGSAPYIPPAASQNIPPAASQNIPPAASQMDMSENGWYIPESAEMRPSVGGSYSARPSTGPAYSAMPAQPESYADMPAQSDSYAAMAPQYQSYAAKRMASPILPPMAGLTPSIQQAPELPMIEPIVRNREIYQDIDDNPVKRVIETPVSTFSIDVDTGSYANFRRFLEYGKLPPMDAVRVEEMINYFNYSYPVPQNRETPFMVTTDMVPAFWNLDLKLLRIGLKGYEVADDQRPAANLVFLIDVSGSMDDPAKLPLLKASLKLLAGKLGEHDRISIVVYAGQAGVVLEPVSGKDKAAIVSAIDHLSAGGSTAGGAGLRLAYEMASKGYIKDGINRILLATDGDFNVGMSDIDELKQLVADKRKGGISLSTLGFGAGNYNDALMEQIADVGDGNYAYIDSLREGRKVLVGELTSTLMTIARDVKIQVEFNPSVVAEYRLVGYENRMLRREDFGNDKVDAGDLGAGHTVTALYELVLADGKGARMEPLRYEKQATVKAGNTDELAYVRLRYKLPGEDKSRLIEVPLAASLAEKSLENASSDLRFAGAVAAFGQILRGGTYTGDFSYDDVVTLARGAFGEDPNGYRREFADLVEIVRDLASTP